MAELNNTLDAFRQKMKEAHNKSMSQFRTEMQQQMDNTFSAMLTEIHNEILGSIQDIIDKTMDKMLAHNSPHTHKQVTSYVTSPSQQGSSSPDNTA
eukprot:12962285-Ditylum_brightwellii.AAC.2